MSEMRIGFARFRRGRKQAGEGAGLISQNAVNVPNLLTLFRIVLVPFVIWAIASGQPLTAFILFVVAGVTDGVDGFIARQWGAKTELGAYLDPLADKALLVSIYVTLGILKVLPAWLVIAVVSRDIMIIGAVVLAWVIGKPLNIAPLIISKANTLAQILLAGVVLGSSGFGLDLAGPIVYGSYAVAALTVGSAAAYLAQWTRHMAA